MILTNEYQYLVHQQRQHTFRLSDISASYAQVKPLDLIIPHCMKSKAYFLDVSR